MQAKAERVIDILRAKFSKAPGDWHWIPGAGCWQHDDGTRVRWATPMGGMSGDEPQTPQLWLYPADGTSPQVINTGIE